MQLRVIFGTKQCIHSNEVFLDHKYNCEAGRKSEKRNKKSIMTLFFKAIQILIHEIHAGIGQT